MVPSKTLWRIPNNLLKISMDFHAIMESLRSRHEENRHVDVALKILSTHIGHDTCNKNAVYISSALYVYQKRIS